MGDTDSFKKNDDEKIVIKNKFPSHELFKKDYFGEDIDLYFLNNDLTSGNYQKFSVQFFLKGFK